MFLFQNHPKLTHRQVFMVAFVLAILSVLTTAIFVFFGPFFLALLHHAGIYQLDAFLTASGLLVYLAAQGLLLFGFPLYYVHDQKDHMTGFQILLYALFWILVLAGFIVLISTVFS